MARALGIGGVFLRSADPASLQAWYVEHLGLEPDSNGFVVIRWGGDARESAGSTVWAAFPSDTEYFGDVAQQAMFNYRVDDLSGLLAQLRDLDVPVDDHIEEIEGIGRFGWATDPEGNRFELWEPAPGC